MGLFYTPNQRLIMRKVQLSKMKDLVMDILELYNDEHLALTDIAAQLGITVEMVETVIDEWGLVDQNRCLGQ